MPKRVLTPHQVAARRRRNQIRRARRRLGTATPSGGRVRVAGVQYNKSQFERYVQGARNTRNISAAMNGVPPPVPSRAGRAPLRRGQAPPDPSGGLGSPEIQMSPAAKAYLACLLDCMTHPPVAMPIGGLESLPVRCFSKGTFSIGTTLEAGGYPGMITVDWGQACFSDLSPGWTSSSSYIAAPPQLSNVPATPVGTVALANTTTNSPYKSTSLGASGLKYRLVAGLMRIRLLTTVNSTGGQTVVYTSPQHSSVNGVSMSTALADPACGQEIIDVDANWITCVYNGVKQPSEQAFSGALLNLPISGIFINGVTSGVTFLYEIYTACEFICQGASLTPSSTDMNGAEAAHTGIARAMVDHPGTHGAGNFFKEAIASTAKVLADNSSTFGHLFSDVAKSSAVRKFISDALPVVGKAAKDIDKVRIDDRDVGIATARALGW